MAAVRNKPFTCGSAFSYPARRYPGETLEEASGEGIATGHPGMPAFRCDPGRIADRIALLKSLA